MKILLLGKGGQVGWELQRSLAPLGTLVAVDFDSTDYGGDFTQPERLRETVRAVRPDVIVNAAAHTAVDKAESEPALARLINATSPGVVAEEARALGALMVHYSTDYVFDGSGSHRWVETDATGPLSVYGQTKLEGEQSVMGPGGDVLVFRTSWVYAARGANFAKTMIRLARERETLSVVADQSGAPTGAELLADVTAQAIVRARASSSVCGLYHCVAAGETTWFDYANHVFTRVRQKGIELALRENGVSPVTTDAYPTPAQRPKNSRLDTSRLCDTFGLQLPDWRVGVDRMLTEFLEK
jgi:dTDP-4-dehydrorhamnose reductase